MDGDLANGIDLARGSSLRIDDGAGTLVYVWEGELWITQEGDTRDHFVSPGRWFRIERDGTSLLYATRSTRVTLTPARRERQGWIESLLQRLRLLGRKHSFQ
jgi:Protein of unknown function (DUF2917)